MSTSATSTSRDVTWASYWNDATAQYRDEIDTNYHRDRMGVVDALLGGVTLANRLVVDFGCGEGIMFERLAGAGARVVGIDACAEMVEHAHAHAKRLGATAEIRHGSVDTLGSLADGSVACLISLNVLAYLTGDEEDVFYRELVRILEPGGSFIVIHSNELFDLYTLNAYTRAFFVRHFVDERRGADVAGLLAHADRPSRTEYNVRENPLAYRHKLARFGLREVQQEFANVHDVPPLLMDAERSVSRARDRAYPSTLNVPEADRWKLMFMCSMYASRSVREA